jgi:ribose 5-phosphate isomerase A
MNLKVECARAALGEVRDGMKLGLGTGTTAAEFVRLLGAALREGRLRGIRCTCTSEETAAQARAESIPVEPLAALAPLDLVIDGADEIDSALRLIKGRGGALLREKIVEQQAGRFIVIADQSKLVPRLGSTQPLPVEVTPFAREVLERRLAQMDLDPVLRFRDGRPFVTDEGNLIFDVRVPESGDIAGVVAEIREHAGVVDTGFFPREATEAVIASPDGIRWLRRER